MMLAKSQSAVFWGDDVVLGFVAETDLGVPIIWTQAALRSFVDSKCLSLADFDLVTAKLVSWNYTAITWNASTVIAAGVEADWKPEAWPLSRCLTVISQLALRAPEKVRIVVDILILLRRSNCTVLKQSDVIHAILDAFRDPRAVALILELIDNVFGVDIPSADFVRFELRAWLGLS